MSGYFYFLPGFIEIYVFNANSVDPDQTPRVAASDLGLQCLPMSLLQEAKLKCVKDPYCVSESLIGDFTIKPLLYSTLPIL